MRYGMLGPVEVRTGDTVVSLGGPRQERIMAMLLVSQGRPVSAEQLVDVLWPEDPPSTARQQVCNGMAMMRRRLRDAGMRPGTLTRQAHGYLLDVPRDRVDRACFELTVAAARGLASAGRLGEAVEEYRAAEGLWRGPALDGHATGPLAAPALRLEELRLQAVEDRTDAELTLGRYEQVLPGLIALVHEHSGRDRLQLALLRTLHRLGRTAEAVRAFSQIRARMLGQFGVGPSPALQRLHASLRAGLPD